MSNLTKGILLAILSVFTAATMALFFKLIGNDISTFEKVFSRGIASMLITLSVIFYIQRHVKAKYKDAEKLTLKQAQMANVGFMSTTSAPPAALSTVATMVPAKKIIKPHENSPVKMMATAQQIPRFFGSWHNVKWLFIRGITGCIAMYAYVYTCNTLSLADADMMTKLTSVALILISALILREKTSLTQFAVVVFSFVGAMIIIKPSFNNPNLGSYGIGLIGTLCSALTYISVRRLTTDKNGEHPLTIECILGTMIVLVSIVPTIYYHTGFTGKEMAYLYLLIASLLSVVGQYTFTFALKFAPAVDISVYSYSSLLWNCIYGVIFFATIPDVLSITGYVMIVAAGVGLFFYNKRRLKVISAIRKMLHEEAAKRKAAAQAAAQATQATAQTTTPTHSANKASTYSTNTTTVGVNAAANATTPPATTAPDTTATTITTAATSLGQAVAITTTTVSYMSTHTTTVGSATSNGDCSYVTNTPFHINKEQDPSSNLSLPDCENATAEEQAQVANTNFSSTATVTTQSPRRNSLHPQSATAIAHTETVTSAETTATPTAEVSTTVTASATTASQAATLANKMSKQHSARQNSSTSEQTNFTAQAEVLPTLHNEYANLHPRDMQVVPGAVVGTASSNVMQAETSDMGVASLAYSTSAAEEETAYLAHIPPPAEAIVDLDDLHHHDPAKAERQAAIQEQARAIIAQMDDAEREAHIKEIVAYHEELHHDHEQPLTTLHGAPALSAAVNTTFLDDHEDELLTRRTQQGSAIHQEAISPTSSCLDSVGLEGSLSSLPSVQSSPSSTISTSSTVNSLVHPTIGSDLSTTAASKTIDSMQTTVTTFNTINPRSPHISDSFLSYVGTEKNLNHCSSNIPADATSYANADTTVETNAPCLTSEPDALDSTMEEKSTINSSK